MYVEGLLVELTVLRSAGGRPYGACVATTDFNNALGMSVLGSFVCGFTNCSNVTSGTSKLEQGSADSELRIAAQSLGLLEDHVARCS